jgi:lycopene cyclase domain-containing protein
MTYAQFLVSFLVPPILLLSWWLRRRLSRQFVLALALLAVVALIYTTPWDAYLIASGVWRYPAGRVLGVHIARVPIEECTFYVLQVAVTGLVTLAVLNRARSRARRS